MANKVKIIGVLLIITIISMCIAGCTSNPSQVQVEGNSSQQITLSPQQTTELTELQRINVCLLYNCTNVQQRNNELCEKYSCKPK